MSASIFDFAVFFYHNANELVKRGRGPYFYLPKMEHYLEARLWNDIFLFSQSYIGMPHNTIRATVLIETLPAAFHMEEILFELRNHSSGLNCGRYISYLRPDEFHSNVRNFRWDYIFSFIKKRRADRSAILPDRKDVTMTVGFMDAYVRLLIQTCHKYVVLTTFIPAALTPHLDVKLQRWVECLPRFQSRMTLRPTRSPWPKSGATNSAK